VTDSLALLSRALDQTAHALDRAEAADPMAATPCPAWDLATLASHVVFDLEQFTTAAQGGRPDWTRPVPHRPDGWSAAFRTGAAGLLAAWNAAGPLDELVTVSMGEVPRSFLVNQQLVEFVVHAWDIDQATGHSGQFDDEPAAAGLAWARTVLQPSMRGEGKAFGVEVPAPDGASPTVALVAFSGRNPTWPG
jgi:uncharacterized protein (TIGR03086 family)